MSTPQLSQTPFTPPPSTTDATLRTIKYHKMILHSNKNQNKLSSLLFSNGRAKPKREWKYLKGFPELSSNSLSKSKCKLVLPPSSIKSTPNTSPTHTPTSIPKPNPNIKLNTNNIEHTHLTIVITPFSDNNETDYSSSSSFTTYPTTYNPTNTTNNNNNIKNNNKNTCNHLLNNNNTILDDSTDYDLSSSEQIHSAHNDNDYPWPTDSDDSFANLDEIEVYKKLKAKLTPKIQSDLKISTTIDDEKLQLENKLDKAIDKSVACVNDEIEIDPKWYDKETGKYLSFIILPTPPVEEDYDNGYISEYEGDNDNEYDNHLTQVNTLQVNTLQVNTLQLLAMPLQSACTPVDSDVLVCNITDIDE